MAPEISFFARLIFGTILAFVATLNVYITLVIIKKNYYDMKPMNIFQANYFAGIGLITLTGVFSVYKNLENTGEICPKEFLRYLFNIMNIYDIVILQLDRFIAVQYPYFYHDYMDINMAMRILILSKIVSIAIAVIASVIDPIFIYCPACGRCLSVRSINVYTVCYPLLVAFVLTLVVSYYASKAIHSLNSVQPVVQLPTVSIKVTNKTKNETATNQNEEEISPNNAQEEINIGKLLNEIEGEENIQEEATHDHDPGPSTSQNVSRIQSDKNIEIGANNLTDSCSQGIIRKLILRKTLTMNLLTLSLMFGFLPNKLSAIFYENCDPEKGECDFFFKSFMLPLLIQLVFGFIHPLVVLLILDP